MSIFMIADTHFGHNRMVDFRPFDYVEEMNEALIENWNKVVTYKDEIYHLGDVSFTGRENTEIILGRLKGRKHLVLGNHDKMFRKNPVKGFETIQDYKELKLNGQVFVMFHFPIHSWDRSHYGTIHLHGHSHGHLPDEGRRRFDVGVDTTLANYSPVSIEEIINLADERPVAEYHH